MGASEENKIISCLESPVEQSGQTHKTRVPKAELFYPVVSMDEHIFATHLPYTSW